MVATLGLLLLYTTSTLVLLLVGRVVIANDASPNVLDDATENVADERVEVARATVSVLLVFVSAAYSLVAACTALNDTSPAPTRVIKLPHTSMVATLMLLLVYVIAPSLSLVGRVIIANDASPNVFVLATVNVDDEREEKILTSAIPLKCFTPYPPYKLYDFPFMTTLVILVYVLFVSRL